MPVSPDGKSEDIALGLNFVKTEFRPKAMSSLLPSGETGKSEDIALGLNFVKTEWLEMPVWPFIDKVVFLEQLKDLQLSAGWSTNPPAKATRYFGVIIMSGENNLAISMVQNAQGSVVVQQ